MRLAFALLVVLALADSGSSAAQSVIDDDFNSGVLSSGHWCPCQIDDDEPVTFPFDTVERGTRYAQIVVNDFALGGNKCRTDPPHRECKPPANVVAAAFGLSPQFTEPTPPDLPEPLGPSFFGTSSEPLGPSLLAPPGGREGRAVVKNPYCTDDVELRAHRHHEDDECIQRQELRLHKFKPSPAEAYLYSFRFRMPAEDKIGDRMNSIRWVIAQWKEEPLDNAYTDEFGSDWGPGPFLALRFDDGVLHVTVQDEDCRCLVASAPAPSGGTGVWTEDNPAGCRLAAVGPHEDEICTPAFNVDYGSDPVLSSALGSWVELRFRVQARRGPDARIEVFQGDRAIVTVIGKIGYEYSKPPDDPTVTKFKIGHYRDYMPFPATMDVDWLKVEKIAD